MCVCVCVYGIYLLCVYINKYTHTVYILKIRTCIYVYIFRFIEFRLYINICNMQIYNTFFLNIYMHMSVFKYS